MAVDWTKPIEAVHEDGRVVPVSYRQQGEGYRATTGTFNDSWSGEWLEDGTPYKFYCRGWRIRNVQSTAPKSAISDELVERMVALVRKLQSNYCMSVPPEVLSEAATLVAELPQPVDPDLLEARRYLVDRQYCRQETADSGKFDDHEVVGGFLAGLARGRALERGEP